MPVVPCNSPKGQEVTLRGACPSSSPPSSIQYTAWLGWPTESQLLRPSALSQFGCKTLAPLFNLCRMRATNKEFWGSNFLSKLLYCKVDLLLLFHRIKCDESFIRDKELCTDIPSRTFRSTCNKEGVHKEEASYLLISYSPIVCPHVSR